jgi:hypothetical protein
MQCVNVCDVLVKLDSSVVVGFELECSSQQRERVVHVITRCGQLSCAPQPRHCPRSDQLEPTQIVTPGEILLLGSHRLSIVMCEHGCSIVAVSAARLEPCGVVRMQMCPAAFRKRPICNLARERMLEDELPLTLGRRRAGAAANEVALLEGVKIRSAVDDPTDAARQEAASDHRSRLQSSLLCGSEQIDPRGNQRANRVRNHRLGRTACVSAVRGSESATLDQGRKQFLEKERVPLRPLELLSHPRRHVLAQERRDKTVHVSSGERL